MRSFEKFICNARMRTTNLTIIIIIINCRKICREKISRSIFNQFLRGISGHQIYTGGWNELKFMNFLSRVQEAMQDRGLYES